jgi:hypothetical protein
LVGLRDFRFMLICIAFITSGERVGTDVTVAMNFPEELCDNWKRMRRRRRRRRWRWRRRMRRRRRTFT